MLVEHAKKQLRNIFTLKTKAELIRIGFFHMMFIETLQIIVNSLNNFIDSIITGQLLGTETLAAVGFFQPMLTIIGLEWIVIIGVQILCGKYTGRNKEGDKEKVLGLFVTSILVLSAIALLLGAACLFASDRLAEILGARGDTAVLLSDYLQGYSFGIIGQILYPLLLWGLSFLKGKIKLSAITVMMLMIVNISLDLLFVLQFELGAFGLGLATSISYLVTSGFIFANFFTNKSKNPDENQNLFEYVSISKLQIKPLIKSMRYGFPAFMFNVGITIKAYLMNMTLMESVGDAAVAVMAVQGNIVGILGAVPIGCSNAYMALGSMYYGQEDRFSVKNISKLALKKCILFSAAIMILLMSLSSLIPLLFFNPHEEAYFVARRMLLLFPSFLVINGILGIFCKAYQFQKKNEKLVNAMGIIENLLMAVIAVAFTPVIGSDAVWLSFPASEIICLLMVAGTVFKDAGEITFKLTDWIELDRHFGKDKSRFFERSFSSLKHAVTASEDAISFCKKNGVDVQQSVLVGIVVEELATNVIVHSANSGKVNFNAYLRVLLGEKISVQVCDDTPKFNAMDQDDKEQVSEDEELSIHLVKSISKNFQYQRSEHRYTAGINNVIVEL